MAKSRNRSVPLPLLLIFVSAVLVPSIALSFLALRAADRESLYVERRLESSLLAEVDLAARRIAELADDIAVVLRREASALRHDRAALSAWKNENPLVDVPFLLRNGRLTLPGDSSSPEAAFLSSFGPFLRNGARLPVYDSIARVYRKEMQEEPSAPLVSRPVLPDSAVRKSASVPDRLPEHVSMPAPDASLPAVESSLPATSKTSAARKKEAPSGGGIERQQMESLIATDSAEREKAFEKVAEDGFEILQRNVMPQGQLALTDSRQDERSRTVARSRTFGELQAEAPNGMLPYLSDRGLEILFWDRQPNGDVRGCSLRMDVLRERIADVLPAALSEVRVLTVLDDGGLPLVVPDLPAAAARPDWRRPFVAREISPVLPRWEAAAWLLDPAAPASRARFAALAVWVLVALLFMVIAVGSFVILRMLSAEIRLAGQKTTFVANVSHELKTPLTSIRLFAELLLSGKQTSEERRREYLRTMMSEAERLSRLVDDVLAFSKRGRKKSAPQLFCLAELTEETAKQLEPHLTKSGFRLDLRCDVSLPVRGSREELRQVIMNLLSNAEKYSGEQREILVRCRLDGDFAVTEVADRGIGIAPQYANRIFQEFFRVDDSLSTPRSGAGLGLSIARDIARRHGGDVRYAPRPGGGSIFTLLLGASEPDR